MVLAGIDRIVVVSEKARLYDLPDVPFERLPAERAEEGEAYIYGSWASRRAGRPGPPPRDIDVLVVGASARTDLLDAADAAQQKLHTEVNIHTTTPEAWAAQDQPFLVTVASRPMITLVGRDARPRRTHADAASAAPAHPARI